MPNPNIQEVAGKVSATKYEAVDSTDDRFYIAGSLKGGVITFSFVAELADGTRGTVRGGEFFQAMVNHFGLGNIQFIDGEWNIGTPALMTNIDAFNKATAAGDSEAIAATKTPTGRLAARIGFTKVNSIIALPAKATGNYTDVLVQFKRP